MFEVTRGLVLRTTKSLKVNGQSIASGTRVKAMAAVDKDTLKVKIKDARYPKLAGEHLVTRFDNVTQVERGRPATEDGKAPAKAAKKTAKKTPAKKTPAKKTAKTDAVALPVADPIEAVNAE